MRVELERLNNRSTPKHPPGSRAAEPIQLLGDSRQECSWRRVLQQVETVAPTDSTVLILGETGTGKRVHRMRHHQRSRRKDKPLAPANCTSIPKGLFESEFFGHAKGAFTGA